MAVQQTQLQASKWRRFLARPFHDKWNTVHHFLYMLKGVMYYRWVFAEFGNGSVLHKPVFVSKPCFMHIGNNVTIRQGARLEAVLIDTENPPELRIGNNVNIEQHVHIVFMGTVRIEDNVSITAGCSILCGNHPFMDVSNPIKIGDRLAGVGSSITIGEGSFLGIGTVVHMNTRIGKHVVIGTNSVVKRNIPDYCVANGNPATVVMQYDRDAEAWINLQQKA